MAEIKVENNLDYLEKEEGELDDEFLEYSPPSQEGSVAKEKRVEKVKVEQVTSPVSVEKVPEMELIVFTPPPPARDEDLSSVSGQSSDEKEEEANELIHCTSASDDLTCKVRNCHCIEVKKENQMLRKVIDELCRRNGEMDDFFQVEFGERYNSFRNNRKYLIQMGFGKECDPDRMAKGKTDRNTDIVQLLRMVKDENETRSDTPIEIPSSEIGPPTQSIAMEESELEMSLQQRLSTMSNVERRNQRKISKNNLRLKEKSSSEISDLRELLNQSRKRRSSSQSQTECHSVRYPKRVRVSPSPPKGTSATIPDFPELDDGEIGQPKFKLCPLCPLMVPSEELMDHLLIIHKGIHNICPGCNLEFISRRMLRIHFSETHGDRGTGYAKFQASISIEPEVKEWLSEMVKLAIPVSQEDFDNLEEIPNAVNDEGWCIYVHNLGPDMCKRDLYDLFEPFGEIERVKVVRDLQTNNSKGFGFVSMRNYEEAVLAIHSQNGLTLSNSNKVLHVSFAKTTVQRLLKCHA